MRTRRPAALAGLVVLGVLVTGCVAEASPDPTPTASPSESAEAAPGTRDNPLPVGERIELSEESAWTVGASGPTVVGDGYVVLPLSIRIDWERIRAQLSAAGEDPETADSLGIDPWASLVVRFIGVSGRSYDILDDAAVDIPNQLWQVGTVYPPAEELDVNVGVSVPADEVAGGVWTVLNTGGDAVFLAAG